MAFVLSPTFSSTTRLPLVCAKARKRRQKRAQKRENDLTDLFEENVKTPLVPAKKSSVQKAQQQSTRWKLPQVELRELGWMQIVELLKKGAWVGIGVMVGYFIVVHFVLVGDFVPK